MILFVTLFSLVLNIIYYVVCQKLRIKNFTKYFVGFVAYSLILFFIIFLLELEFILIDFLSFLVIYLLFFISLFLTMPLKYLASPTYLIFKSLKNKNTKKKINEITILLVCHTGSSFAFCKLLFISYLPNNP